MDINKIKDSRVLVRVNYDLPALDSVDRVEDSKETIDLLLNNGNKVVLVSHWGRPDGIDKDWELKKIHPFVEKVLGIEVEYLDQYKEDFEKIGNRVQESESKVFLLNNTRFDADEKSREQSKRGELAKKYASIADYYVDEAFAVSHRKEATNTEIKDKLKWSCGIAYQKEVDALDKFKSSSGPVCIIMGGAKPETKLPIIEYMLEFADKVFLGGQLCFPFIVAAGVGDIRDSDYNKEFVEVAGKLLKKYKKKIVLPMDFVYMRDFNKIEVVDIGPVSLEIFKEKLQGSKAVFWNGPLGMYEQKPYDQGTQEIAKIITDLPDCYTVSGGGDTVSAVDKKILQKFDWVSMGGGATLSYLVK